MQTEDIIVESPPPKSPLPQETPATQSWVDDVVYMITDILQPIRETNITAFHLE